MIDKDSMWIQGYPKRLKLQRGMKTVYIWILMIPMQL